MVVADARRRAHAKVLKGKGGDVTTAEQDYSVALRAAANEIRALLAETGNDPSTATMNAINDTLQALPGNAPPGRLTEPLRLVGFEALAGLVPASERVLRGLTPPPPPEPAPRRVEHATPAAAAAAARREAHDKKRADAARRREQADTLKSLRAARQEAREAESAVASAQRDLVRARETRDRLQDQLQFAVKKIEDAANAVRTQEDHLAQARREHDRLEAKLATFRRDSY
jgi:hypothetical protein